MSLMECAISNMWTIIIAAIVGAILLLGLGYHSIFKPDYRPGHMTMPFVWFQLVSSVYKRSQKAPLLSSYYNVQSLYGLCKLNEHQKILSFNILGRVWVFLFTPEAAEVVLSSTRLIEKSDDYKGMKVLLRGGLVTSKAETWRSRRKLLTPAFHFKILQDFTPLLQDICKSILVELDALVDEPWVEVGGLMKTFCALMFFKTILGPEFGLNNEERETLLENANEFVKCFNVRLSRPWLYFDILFRMSPYYARTHKTVDFLTNFIKKIVVEKKKKKMAAMNGTSENGVKQNGYIENHNIDDHPMRKRQPFLDILLEQHFIDDSFTEDDVVQEAIVFFGAGGVTLGTGLCYVIYCIGLYQDAQKKIHEELDEIFQGSDRIMTEEDLKSMKYLECVIKESLRLYSMPYISRKATESFKVYDYTVPEDSTVVIFNYVIQRDPDIYPNPEKFDPSRFFPENSTGRHHYSYLPFSAGPRNCIGQKFAYLELKTVIAPILRKYHLQSLDDRDQLFEFTKLKDSDSTDIPVRVRFSRR